MGWKHPRTWGPEKMTVAKLNAEIRDNFMALKDPPHEEYAPAYAAGTLITTSSTDWVDMTGFELTLNTEGGDVLIILNVDVLGAAFFDIEVNEQRLGGIDGLQKLDIDNHVFIPYLLTDLDAQTLQIVPKWKVSSGSAGIRATTMPYFSAREVS